MPDPSFAALQRSVDAAQAALVAVVDRSPGRWWDPKELRAEAQGDLPGDVMMYALTDLVNRGLLRLDQRLMVGARDLEGAA